MLAVGGQDGHGVRLQRLEQQALGGGVVLRGAVRVQVVAGDVGQHGHVVAHVGDALLDEGVAGDLHAGVGQTVVDHAAEGGVQGDGVGGGQVRLDPARAEAVAEGAHGAGRPAGLAQDGAQQLGGARLAVGAGDARHAHPAGGGAVEAVREGAQRPARVGHDDRRPPARLFGGPLADDGRGAGLQRVGDVAAPVHLGSCDGDEQRALRHPPRVVGEGRDRRVAVGVDDRDRLDDLQQVAEAQGRGGVGSGHGLSPSATSVRGAGGTFR